MLDCKTKQPWNDFLSFIKEKSSPTEYNNWISPIAVIEQSEEKVVLQVPNIFVQEYLLDNYKKELCIFLPLQKQGIPYIEFVIEQPLKKKMPEIKKERAPVFSSNKPVLNPLYTFENYIEGPSNQFVKSAAIGTATKPGKAYNPLFIHGGVGLGKTHLMHSIGHMAFEKNKNLKIKCITTEAFINDLVDSLRNKSVDKMKKYYRTLDILLVDDIQFLQNRLNFEEEFSNMFEALINQNKQIIITSDKPPSELKLSERIKARMEWGLVANVGIPDLETRVAIIQHKSEQKGCPISHQIAFYIAEHIYNNVRQLEGAINRLCAYARIMQVEITEEMVESILKQMFQISSEKKVSIQDILKSVSTLFEVRVGDITGPSRQKEIAKARQISMYLAKELLDESLMKIAAAFGKKTHSTLLHAWNKIALELKNNDTLKRQIDMVQKNIES